MLGVKLTDKQYRQLTHVYESDTANLDTPTWYRDVFLKEFDPAEIKNAVQQTYSDRPYGKFGPGLFGDGDDDWREALMDLKRDRYQLRIFLKQKLKKYEDRLQFVGAGFDKMVFVTKDGYAVKISYNDADQVANEIDFYLKYGEKCKSFIPKLHDWDRKYKMSELVQCAKEITQKDYNKMFIDDGDMQYLLDVVVGFFTGYDDHVCPNVNIDYVFKNYTKLIVDMMARHAKEFQVRGESFVFDAMSDWRIKFGNIEHHDGYIIKDLRSYVDIEVPAISTAYLIGILGNPNSDARYREIRDFIAFKRANKFMLTDAGKAENWGAVEENGKLRLVLLDVGV